MAEKYVIGIDLGTTSAKCAVYDLDGRTCAEAQREMQIDYPHPGEAEQNAEDFYTYSCDLIRECLSQGRISGMDIAALGIDSQMGGIMTIDQDYNPVTRYDTPLDSRSGRQNTWMHENFGDLIMEKCGSISTFGNKILYWKEREEWKRIYKFIQPSAFAAGRLAGLSGDDAYMDETFICFSGFADLQRSAWSEELCSLMDVAVEKLPRICRSTDVIGEISARGAEDTGLPEGIPIAAGCGDQSAGFTGAGIVYPGQMVDVSGTACILGICSGSYAYDKTHRTLACMKAPVDSNYHLISVVLGGRTHKWFAESFFPGKENIYPELDAKASEIPPGSGGLVSINYLQGRFFPPEPEIRGCFIGHTWAHTPYHFYRAILESIAYDHYCTREIALELVPEINTREITAIGSGVKSDLWMQIKADVLQQKYQSLTRSDCATLGAAIIAARGAGLIPEGENLSDRFVSSDKIITPVPENKKKYEKYIKIYRDLFPVLKNTYKELSGREDEK